ncbi:Uncharacterised protein [Vibrio cholerae]|nr:Uncharacterised protein [Vibrio cholerae]
MITSACLSKVSSSVNSRSSPCACLGGSLSSTFMPMPERHFAR